MMNKRNQKILGINMFKKIVLLTILASNIGIRAQTTDPIKSHQQLQAKIKTAITTEFGSHDEQSPLLAKAIEMACDFYDTTNIESTQKCNDTQACTFAVQALRYAHNTMQIDAFYYIAFTAIMFFEQSHENALLLIVTHANNNQDDDTIDVEEYPEIKNMITQKMGSSPESERCMICAANCIKKGVPLHDVISLTTLITTSHITDEADYIDQAYYLYFAATRYFNETHESAMGLIEFCLELDSSSYIKE